MREGIRGSLERSGAGAHRRPRSRREHARLGLGHLGAVLVHDAHLVGQAGREVQANEAIRDYGQQQNGRGEQDSEPEDGHGAHGLRRADIIPALAEDLIDVLAVQGKVEYKVNDERAPYAKVVEAGPVRCVEATLETNFKLHYTLFCLKLNSQKCKKYAFFQYKIPQN